MKNEEMQNFDIETENFGVEGTMWIPSKKNTQKITEYIKNQLREDQMAEQLTMDLNDPLTGSK